MDGLLCELTFFLKRGIKGAIKSQLWVFPPNLVGPARQNYCWQQRISGEVGVTEWPDDKTEMEFSVGKSKVMHCREKQSEYYIGNEGF